MPDYQQATSVDAPAVALFAYLADVRNLPRYFEAMVDAEPADGEAVNVTAEVHGERQQSQAWFRVDRDAQRISWGSEGPDDYHGELEVTGGAEGANVQVSLHTERVASDEVDEGLRTTVANVKRLVEAGAAPSAS
jgi:uncharacterized membrane protein